MKLSSRIARLEAQIATVRIGPGVSGLLKSLEEVDCPSAWTPTSGWCRRLLSEVAKDKGWNEGILESSLNDALQRAREAGLLAE